MSEFRERMLLLVRRLLLCPALFLILVLPSLLIAQSNWQARVNESIPLLGHRNWILVVDSAYPLQSSDRKSVV